MITDFKVEPARRRQPGIAGREMKTYVFIPSFTTYNRVTAIPPAHQTVSDTLTSSGLSMTSRSLRPLPPLSVVRPCAELSKSVTFRRASSARRSPVAQRVNSSAPMPREGLAASMS